MTKYPDSHKKAAMAERPRAEALYAAPDPAAEGVYAGPDPAGAAAFAVPEPPISDIEDVYNGPDPEPVESVYDGPDPDMMATVYAGPNPGFFGRAGQKGVSRNKAGKTDEKPSGIKGLFRKK